MSKFNSYLTDAKIKDTPKIKAVIMKRVTEGERLSREMMKYFQAMARNIDDMEGRAGMKIMNVHSKIKEAAKSVGIG